MKDWRRVLWGLKVYIRPPTFNVLRCSTASDFKWAKMFSWNISKQLFILGFTESCLKHHGKGMCQTENRSERKCLNPTRFPAALKCVVFVGLHLAVRLIPSRLKMKMGEGAVNPHKNIFWGWEAASLANRLRIDWLSGVAELTWHARII